MGGVLLLARIRRPPGGGHFLFALSRNPALALVVLVCLVALAVYLSRRR